MFDEEVKKLQLKLKTHQVELLTQHKLLKDTTNKDLTELKDLIFERPEIKNKI